MSWGRLDDTFHDEPKFFRLAERLGISFVEAAGHMAILWSWAHRHAPDGDLRDFDVPDIARAAKWGGDPGVFVAALSADRVELIDHTDFGFVLHRFMERAEARKAAKKKQRQRGANKKDRRSVVYVIERGDGQVKIGFTTDLSRRMSEYNEGRARLVAFCDGDLALEGALHARFSASRIGRTEFFERTPEIDQWIQSLTPVSRDTFANGPVFVPQEKTEKTEKTERRERRESADSGGTLADVNGPLEVDPKQLAANHPEVHFFETDYRERFGGPPLSKLERARAAEVIRRCGEAQTPWRDVLDFYARGFDFSGHSLEWLRDHLREVLNKLGSKPGTSDDPEPAAWDESWPAWNERQKGKKR